MTDQAPEQIDVGELDEIRPGAWFAPGRQMVVSDALVQGVAFAHHVTEAELSAGWLEVVPDFAAIAAFAHRSSLAGGGDIEVVELDADDVAAGQPRRLVLKGGKGWLDDGKAGATAILSLDGEEIHLTWAPPLEVIDVDPTPIAATFDQVGAGQPVPLLDLVLHLLIEHRPLFEGEVAVPMRDLLLVGGLDLEGTNVVRAGTSRAARRAEPAGLPGLAISSSLAAERLLAAALETDADAPVTAEVLEALADVDAVGAVAEQVVGGALIEPEQLAALVARLDAAAAPGTGAPLGFLKSRLAEWQGDAIAQEAALAPAVGTGNPAALVDAAEFAADRGDAREALALLRSAHVPNDDPDLALLARYTATGPRWVGRNDPCWCGSGKKHKHCHLHLNGHDLAARVPWLHAKAVMFLQRPPQRTMLLGIATAAAGLRTADEAPAKVIAAACDVAITEVCLFQAGIFDKFVAHRGVLLPDDERELAESWVGQKLHVWDVVGGGTALRDPSSGDERPVDTWSRTKIPAEGLVLAVAQAGPIALPGLTIAVAPRLADELREVLADDDVLALARLVGRELGWVATPDLGSSADPAEDALAPAP